MLRPDRWAATQYDSQTVYSLRLVPPKNSVQNYPHLNAVRNAGHGADARVHRCASSSDRKLSAKALAFGDLRKFSAGIWCPWKACSDEEAGLSSPAGGGAGVAVAAALPPVVDAGTRAEGDVSAVARATQKPDCGCVLGFIW